MTKIDYERLAKFKTAVITMVSDDGFPFSIPTSFHVTSNHEILLEKPKISTRLEDRKVNALFNHITGIPTGGYTDRRYMLLWGTLREDHGNLRLDPQSMSEWDEKILPFPDYCAKVAPQGARYLENLQPSVVA